MTVGRDVDELDTPNATTDAEGVGGRLPLALGRRAFVVVFLLWWAVAGAWAAATPIWGSPDEPQHAYRAYAAVRGEVFVQPEAASLGTGGYVTVPKAWADSARHLPCYAFRPTRTADCLHPLANEATPTRVASTAARYNPIYYLIVGTGSLVTSPAHAIWAMRLISAALSALFLAWALTSAAASRRPIIAGAAVVLAATPMVGFLASAVNPNGMEITAAMSMWVNGYLALTLTGELSRRILIRRTAISAIALVVSRALSPLWVLVVVGILLVAVASRERLVAQRAAYLPWAGAVGLAAFSSVGWTYFAKTLVLNVSTHPGTYSFLQRWQLAWGGQSKQSYLWRGTIGTYGWLDTLTPLPTVQLWTAGAAFLLLLAVVISRARGRIAVVLLGAAVVLIPTFLEALNWNTSGGVWQPRYTMPISLGVVLLAGMMLAQSSRWQSRPLVELALGAALCGVAVWTNLCGFVVAISRYAVGVGKPISLNGAWHPPVPATFLVAVEGLAWLALSALVLNSVGLLQYPRREARTAPLGVG